MPDPTLQFLERFDDATAWDNVMRGVPVFIEHETIGKDGKPIKVNLARLKKIAANMLKKQMEKGVVVRNTDGHTRLVTDAMGKVAVAPQEQQPQILSYSINPRVGTWGPEQLPAILVDEYVVKGKGARRRELPYRSPEFFTATDDIDAVALLPTKPRLDMGMVTYAGHACDRMTLYASLGDYQFYAMEVYEMPDPTEAPDAAKPGDEEMSKWKACADAHYPHLGKMHEAYAATMAAPPAPAPAMPAGPVAPAQPAPQTTKIGVPETPGAAAADAKKEYAAAGIPEQYAKMFAERDAAQTARIAAMEKQLRAKEYQSELAPLCEAYGLDLAKKTATCAGMDRAAFEAYKAELKADFEAYRMRLGDPTAGPATLLDTGGNPGELPSANGNRAVKDLIGTQAQLDRAVHYQQEYPGCSGDESWDYAISGAKTPRDYRRNGVAAKK